MRDLTLSYARLPGKALFHTYRSADRQLYRQGHTLGRANNSDLLSGKNLLLSCKETSESKQLGAKTMLFPSISQARAIKGSEALGAGCFCPKPNSCNGQPLLRCFPGGWLRL